MDIRQLTAEDASLLRQFWIEHWGADFMVAHGRIYRPEQLEGFVIEDDHKWIGILTYLIENDECEVTSLNSLHERQGIGTQLINAVVEEAQKRNCRRLFLITTNDNLNALGFYQRRGFELVKINRGAVNAARKIKPSIPLIGMSNIPLRDEIELEMIL